MTMIEQIHRGRRHSPPRLLIYGTEGIGKSTTAAQAPNPIFIPTEDGLDQIDCASFPLAKSLADVEAALRALITEQHDFETVVIDSADWLERLVWDALCEQYGASSIEKVDGGFGRERTIAAGLGKDGGERILRCVGSPACVAKNRYNLPAELPLSWSALMQAMTTTQTSKENING